MCEGKHRQQSIKKMLCFRLIASLHELVEVDDFEKGAKYHESSRDSQTLCLITMRVQLDSGALVICSSAHFIMKIKRMTNKANKQKKPHEVSI